MPIPGHADAAKVTVPKFEDEDLISFDETSQILSAPWHLSTREVVSSIRKARAAASSSSGGVILLENDFPTLPLQATSTVSAKPIPPAVLPSSRPRAAWGAKATMPATKPARPVAKKMLPKSIVTAVTVATEALKAVRLGPGLGPKAVAAPANPEFHPDIGGFKAQMFWIPMLDKFKCPHLGCRYVKSHFLTLASSELLSQSSYSVEA